MKKLIILILFCTFTAICSAQSLRPMVKDISATINSDTSEVVLSWELPANVAANVQELLIYRNTGSIIKTSTLSILEPKANLSAETTTFTDTVRDYNMYYYAVVAKTIDGKMYDVIIPTINATNEAIVKEKLQVFVLDDKPEIENIYANAVPKIDTNVSVPLRERPLPVLGILPAEEDVPSLSEETLTITSSLPQSHREALFSKPYILSEDMNGENATGDDYTLFVLVNTFVIAEDWENAKTELTKFLQINRSTEATARANFYLAQTYYFQKEYRLSLTHFQRAEKLYPVYSKRWIEEVLNQYTIG